MSEIFANVFSGQDAPHPHQAIVDPTGQYLLVPDLGADLVRVYSICPKKKTLTATAPLVAKAGSGPRHGTFSRDPISGKYVYYLVSELAGTITAYTATYGGPQKGITFKLLEEQDSRGPGKSNS